MRVVGALLLILALVTPWGLWWLERQARQREVQSLKAELEAALASPRLRDAEAPQVVRVEVPGGPQPVEVPVRVERITVPVPVERGESVRVIEVPKLVVTSPPVPCRSEEECRRLFAQAPQAVHIEASLPRGTVVPVNVTVAGQQQEVNAPLSRDVPLQIDLVLSERGVFHVLQPPSDLQVTEVRTETTLPAPTPTTPPNPTPTTPTEPQPLPDRGLRLAAALTTHGAALALEYQNQVAGGWYRVQVGWMAGPAGTGPYAGVWFVFPLGR